ncbi:MAG TPA: hypothetical protein DEA08_06680, partial [Planctomycetes bacterium]|nr:hypothetical protein [Planctomycetota bacterium]
LFAPTAASITAGPNLATARSGHAAMTWFDGNDEKVLVAGGVAALNTQTNVAPALDSAEVYDVASGTFSPVAATLTEAQAGAHFARLDTGGLLLVGGAGLNGPAAAQVFDPTSQTFGPAPNVVARSGAAAASKGSEVLLAGGQNATGTLEDSSEVYDSATNTFSPGQLLGEARKDASATIAGGEVVLIGGQNAQGASDRVERVDGVNLLQATVTKHVDLLEARYAHSATATTADTIIVIGGFDANGVPTASVERVDLNASVATTSSGSTSSTTSATATTAAGSTASPNPGMTPGSVAPGAGSGATLTPGSAGSTAGSSG